jgi:hypothetical protein
MKKIEIGGKLVNIAQTTADMTAIRMSRFKWYALEDEHGMSLPSISETFKKFSEAFDRDSKAAMFIAIYEYMRGINKVRDNHDPKHMMFALMTLEEGESDTNVDETFLREKRIGT